MDPLNIIASYREVNHTSDGCSLYACDGCEDQWESRTKRVNFCPFCGMLLMDGLRKTRPRGFPRWVWDRWGDDYPFGLVIHPVPKPDRRVWQIVRVHEHFDIIVARWSYRHYRAAHVLESLKRHRNKDKAGRYTFYVRLVNE